MAMPFATHDLALLRPVLAATFALSDPVQHGRQRVCLHIDQRGCLHRLRDRAMLAWWEHRLAQDHGAEEQQTA